MKVYELFRVAKMVTVENYRKHLQEQVTEKKWLMTFSLDSCKVM